MLFEFTTWNERFAFITQVILIAILFLLSLVAPLALAAPGGPGDPLTIKGPVAAGFAVQAVDRLAVVNTVPLDIAALRLEDEYRETNGLPPRFALPENTWVTPEESGNWEDLDDHYQLWRTRISAPGALSLNLGFTGYHLPKGARLSLYPADVTGPDDPRGVVTFTSRDNEDHGELWTPVILADEIVVELVLPRDERHNYRLELTAINKGYRYFGADPAVSGYDKAGVCNVDVVCPEGNAWRDEISSVGVISTGGSTFCTGSMLNNTAADGTPYFLTANHCNIKLDNAPSLVVYWNFQSPICGDRSGGSLHEFMTGATFLASSSVSDFTLVKMDDPVDPAFGITFAGWDRSKDDPTSATAIHHPWGDEKSISFENDPTTTTTYLQTAVPGDGSHIRITDWDTGTTEPGSSGSPLFDQNHHVVGQLHGGYAACGNDLSDWYGRFSRSWPAIAQYLDPLGTGQVNLDTYAPFASDLEVTGAPLNGVGDIGGPFVPSSTVYTLTNFSKATLDYQVTANVDWVEIAGGDGSLAAGGMATVTVAYSAVAKQLPSGLRVGTIDFTNLTSGNGNTVRLAQLQIAVPKMVYSYDLTTDPGWVMNGDWDYGVPAGAGGEKGNADPSAGYTGNRVLGFNLAGDYMNNLAPTYLVTTAIDCSELTGTSLHFRRWLNVEQPAYDHAVVSVSTDSVNFTPVWANDTAVTDSSWVPVSYDISAVADHSARVYIRWTMGTTDGSWEFSGWNLDDIEIWAVTRSVAAVRDVPSDVLSVGNYPNPFNPLTEIDYVLARVGPASVRVYDLQGRLVRELVNGEQPAGPGSVIWDGNDADGLKAASGVYFAQVLSGGQRAVHKMVLLK